MKQKLSVLMRCFFVFLLLTRSVVLSGCNKPNKSDYHVAAYIWPSCHHDERFGGMLWPEGTGEWEIIKKGTPWFEGHYQPKVPLWGYEPDDDPKVMERWIDAATEHGINVFIFDWYWFEEGPFLESTFDNGFLKAKNNEKMQFYIMWANHDVKRNYWNVHKYKDDTSLLWNGAVDLKSFKIIIERVITQYFKQPNYFKIDGKPVFSVFSIRNLIEGFGGLEEARQAINYFREETFTPPCLSFSGNEGVCSCRLRRLLQAPDLPTCDRQVLSFAENKLTRNGPKNPVICNLRHPEFISGSDDQDGEVPKQVRDDPGMNFLGNLKSESK